MNIWKEVWEYVKMLVMVVVIVFVIDEVVLINAKIPSASMENTIMTKDRLFGFRMAYGINVDFFTKDILTVKMRDPERMDIVIFRYPDDEKQLFIKRIIGLPGEKVQIREGRLYINGKEQKRFKENILSAGLAAYEIKLGEDEYFVLGDNYNNSEDSRVANIGNIKRNQFVGKAAWTVREGKR